MFDKVQKGKQLLKMRGEAKKLQKQMAEITETVEEGGVKVKVSADQKILYIEKDGEKYEDVVKAVNKAFKKVQKKAAVKMMQEGGLSSLLGGM